MYTVTSVAIFINDEPTPTAACVGAYSVVTALITQSSPYFTLINIWKCRV